MRLGGNGSFPGPRGCPDPRTRLTTVGIHSGIGANQRQLPGAHPVGILRQGLSPTCASKGAGVEEKPHLRNVLQVLLQGLGTGNPSGSAPVIHQELALVRLGQWVRLALVRLSQTTQRSLPQSFPGDPRALDRSHHTFQRSPHHFQTPLRPCRGHPMDRPTGGVPARGDGPSPGGHGARAAPGGLWGRYSIFVSIY